MEIMEAPILGQVKLTPATFKNVKKGVNSFVVHIPLCTMDGTHNFCETKDTLVSKGLILKLLEEPIPRF